MNEPWWKSQTMWAMGGAAIGSIVVVALSKEQVDVVDNGATVVASIAACVAVAAAALKAAIARRR